MKVFKVNIIIKLKLKVVLCKFKQSLDLPYCPQVTLILFITPLSAFLQLFINHSYFLHHFLISYHQLRALFRKSLYTL
jgi:hypothetical protein